MKNTKRLPQFDLEHQYQLYLKRMALSESAMHPQQKVQLKQAFYGACGQLLMMFRDDLTVFDDDMAVEIMEDLNGQVGAY